MDPRGSVDTTEEEGLHLLFSIYVDDFFYVMFLKRTISGLIETTGDSRESRDVMNYYGFKFTEYCIGVVLITVRV